MLSFSATVLPLSLPLAAPFTVDLRYQALRGFSSAEGPVARRARVFHLRHLVRHRGDEIVGFDRALHQAAERGDVVVGQRKAALLGDAAKLGWRGKNNCHGALLKGFLIPGVDGSRLVPRLHSAGPNRHRVDITHRNIFLFKYYFENPPAPSTISFSTGLISLKSRPSASARYICIRA